MIMSSGFTGSGETPNTALRRLIRARMMPKRRPASASYPREIVELLARQLLVHGDGGVGGKGVRHPR